MGSSLDYACGFARDDIRRSVPFGHRPRRCVRTGTMQGRKVEDKGVYSRK